jgi:Zn-dependent protease
LTFRILGIPVRLHPSFFIVGLLLSVPRSFEPAELLRVGIWLAVVFVSILWHELGHALVARAFGASPTIELGMMGGLTRTGSLSPGRSLLVSLAGPGAGFVLGGVTWLVSSVVPPPPGPGLTAVYYAIWVNVGWGALNLLPLLPYDGGNVAVVVLDRIVRGRGSTVGRYVSVAVGAVCCALAVRVGWTWAAILAGLAALSSWHNIREARAVAADAHLWERLNQVLAARAEGGSAGESARRIEELLGSALSVSFRRDAVEQLAWTWVLAGDPGKAREQLISFPPGTGPSVELRDALAAGTGDKMRP